MCKWRLHGSAWGDVGGVAGDEASEGGDAHQAVLEDEVAEEGAGYTEADVDDVVVGGVDGGEPYA